MGLKTAGAKLLLKGGLLNRTLYVAAMRSATLEFAAAAENGYATYARQAIALAGWTRTNAGLAENAAKIEFPQPTADSTAAPTHWGLWSAAGVGAGTLYDTHELTGSPAAPASGVTFGFDAGQLELIVKAGAVTARGMRRAFETGLVSGTTYLALHAARPSGGGSQIDTREAVAAAGWEEVSGAGHQVQNASAISFGVQATDVAQPLWTGLWSAATAGQLLWEDEIDVAPEDPEAGANIVVPAESVKIGFTVD